MFILCEDVSMFCLTCLRHLIGLIRVEWSIARWDFQNEGGAQNDSRCAADTSKPGSKSGIQNIRKVKSYIAECRLIDAG